MKAPQILSLSFSSIGFTVIWVARVDQLRFLIPFIETGGIGTVKPSVCPRRRRRRVRTSKNTVFWKTKCTCPWSWLSSCKAQLRYLCVECYNNIVIIIIIIIILIIISIITIIIIIIKPLLKIFNEWKNLTVVGEWNPYWRIFNECRNWTGVGELNPYWRIFNECRSLTGVGELNPYWRSSMSVEV